MARNASTHHDMMICFVRTEKRWGRVEMHWFAINLRLVCDRNAIRLRLGLVALILCLIRGFDSSRIPLLAIMFFRLFA